MRVLLVTDAWYPQVNGVVQTLSQISDHLNASGDEVHILAPGGVTVGCPTYPEIRLTLDPVRRVHETFSRWLPDAVHIATEGPLGWAARAYCLSRRWPFTTSFHTRFPEYIKCRFGVPRKWTYRVLRHFHRSAERTMIPTASVRTDLERAGFTNTVLWGRGVDTIKFHPKYRRKTGTCGPVLLYVGRLAPEKNVSAFLDLETSGTKIVVGSGPLLGELRRRYPKAVFTGALFGDELAAQYASADVFVFPSRTDTFGLVQLESLACGTPVAAFPAAGPRDVLTDPNCATMDDNLKRAIERCLTLDRDACRNFALQHSWTRCAQLFRDYLEPRSQVWPRAEEIQCTLRRHNLAIPV